MSPTNNNIERKDLNGRLVAGKNTDYTTVKEIDEVKCSLILSIKVLRSHYSKIRQANLKHKLGFSRENVNYMNVTFRLILGPEIPLASVARHVKYEIC